MIGAGVAEVQRALAYPERFPHLNGFDRMRQRVANNIVSLAFRRYLSAEKIPHRLVESVNFSQADQLDISFGGRRCVPIAQLICDRELIPEVHKSPKILLEQDIYLPEGSVAPAYRDVDIYLFIHFTGLVTRSRDDVEKAIVAKQPVSLVYQMPENWSRHPRWETLDPLVLKTDLTDRLTLDLHGQDRQRSYLKKSIHLPGRERVEIEAGFYGLGVLQAATLPLGPVGLFSQAIGETLLVAPFEWGNIWIYGMQLFITGYMTQADFYRHARRIDAGTAELANPCLQDETLLGISASALKPPQDLFIRAANWEQMQNK